MRKLLLASAVFLFSFDAQAECLAIPSCAELGYTKTTADCPKGALKCPFGETVFCENICDNKLQIGSILYSDKSICSNLIHSKTPIAIVFDTENRLAVALESKRTIWSENATDIPTLENWDGSFPNAGVDGKTNTRIILEHGKANSVSYPAAEYCANYKTSGTNAGDWFMPSYMQLVKLNVGQKEIEASANKISAANIYDYTWSSTENNAIDAWLWKVTGGGASTKKNSNRVRAVIEF